MSDSKLEICGVCLRSGGTHQLAPGTHSTMIFTCPACGIYYIDYGFAGSAKNAQTLTPDERLRLSHAIRKATDARGRFKEAVLDHSTYQKLIDQHQLPDPVDQADLFVDLVARATSYGEKTDKEPTDVWATRLGLKTSKQMFALAKELEKLIESTPVTTGGVLFNLTLEGWRRAREIRRVRGPGNQAFVAMWFHPDLDAAFDDGFLPALDATGYKPYRVDRDAHNEKIDDKIIAEIRRSKLVIVDATGARPNAYFEAGLAAGLGIPVIWCCSDSPTAPGLTAGAWTDNLPFDIRQHAFTFWSDPADLKEKLTNRIRALGFDAAWNRGQ